MNGAAEEAAAVIASGGLEGLDIPSILVSGDKEVQKMLQQAIFTENASAIHCDLPCPGSRCKEKR